MLSRRTNGLAAASGRRKVFPGLLFRVFDGSDSRVRPDGQGCASLRNARRLHLWYAVLMTIGAFDPVNIVLALRIGIGGVHFLYVNPAVRHLGMTGLARCTGVLAMPDVAGEAAQALMHAHRRAVVA